MIAVASSGRRFRALIRYLEHGRDGETPNRIEWLSVRNLVVEDPRVAARVMQATAETNPKVDHPVYHVAVSFHPDDRVTRAQMVRVANRLLHELGLADHQALIVAHADRPHAHVHLVVNRIHPETGKAWNRWQDRVTTQRVLREEERALGLHEVPGRLYQLPGRPLADHTAETRGEHRTAERTGEKAILPRLRTHLAEYRAATSWADLETRLATDHLRLERKGQGLVITDGEREVKASRLARDFSFARLQERLGPYDRTPELDRSAPDERVAGVVRQVRAAEHAGQLDHLHSHAGDRAVHAQYVVDRLARAEARARDAGLDFDRQLAQLYVRPHDARALFDSAVRSHGIDAAVEHLAEHPRAYGTLRPVYRPMLFGVLEVQDDRDGHARAPGIAAAGRHAAVEVALLREVIRESPAGGSRIAADRADAYVHAVTHATERLRHATRRADRLHSERQRVSPHYSVSRELAHVVGSLGPREVQQATLWLTAPQNALLIKAREAAREVALGMER